MRRRPTALENAIWTAAICVFVASLVAALAVLLRLATSWMPWWVGPLVIAVWLCGVFVVCVVKLFCALLDR